MMTRADHDLISELPEIILCAAIWYKDHSTPGQTVVNVEGLVLCGYRHPHIIGQYLELHGRTALANHEQGFLTSKNRFVSREEAAEIAFAVRQIPKQVKKLYSEDLYGQETKCCS
jgi:hypothetical protein